MVTLDGSAFFSWLWAFLREADGAKDEGEFVLYICMACGLVVMAGLMSGLTIGLLSIDHVDIEVLKRSGTETEKKYAAGVESVLANPHYLLCTLVVWNAVAMETLPIFLDRIADPVSAVVLSVTVVLLFGEILPQSICTKYGLAVGYYTKYVVQLLMLMAFPVAYPLGALLDRILGKDKGVFRSRGQIKAFVDMHGEEHHLGGHLTPEEVAVISGALDLTHKTAIDAMTPLDKVFMLSSRQLLDDCCIAAILERGHSRIPVYGASRNDILGLILVKEILRHVVAKEAEQKLVCDLPLRSLPTLSSTTPLYDVLELFKSGRAHMAVLCRPAASDREARPIPDNGVVRHETSPLPSFFASSQESSPAPVHHLQRSASDTGMMHSSSPLAPLLPYEERAHSPRTDGYLTADDSNNNHASEAERTEIERAALVDDVQCMGDPVGIVTIEDVLEELLGVEIVDETDRFVDNMQTQQVNEMQLTRSLPPLLRKVVNVALFKAKSLNPGLRGRLVPHLRTQWREKNDPASDFGPWQDIGATSVSVDINERHTAHGDPMQAPAVKEAASALESWFTSNPAVAEAMTVISTAVDQSSSRNPSVRVNRHPSSGSC